MANEVVFPDQYIEKRRLFLRSYDLSRKRSVADRFRISAVRVRRLVCVRLLIACCTCSARCFARLYFAAASIQLLHAVRKWWWEEVDAFVIDGYENR